MVYFGYLVKSKAGDNASKSVFEIKENTSTYQIGAELKSKGLVKSSWAFYVYTKLKEKTILPGAYLVSENMTTEDVVNKLSNGETAVKKITIPEGWRVEQIAQYLSDNGFVKYDDFIQIAKKFEGKVFPDTYYIKTDSTSEEILDMMLADYQDRTSNLGVSDQELILASIVEREAKNDAERAGIAGVYNNRLKNNMKLEADPTVLYAHDTRLLSSGNYDPKTFEFWQPIAFADYLNENSPYNTYVYASLPPSPICNPGLKSIEAALNPEQSDYLYFFNDSQGNIYYSKTVAEHDQKKALYLK